MLAKCQKTFYVGFLTVFYELSCVFIIDIIGIYF